MRSRVVVVAVVVAVLAVALGVFYYLRHEQTVSPPVATSSPQALPSAEASPAPSTSAEATPTKATNAKPDLTVDSNGLSKATVIMTTTEGVIKFKLYPNDAPNTVKRFIELVNTVENPNTHQPGFYNGLTFHRVIPGFVVQGGDPLGNGTGGSGQKLKAEFNSRHHVEGSVAMARAQDPDSADSQFYFTLGTFPHLDHSYTVFAQVTEGMDVVKKIKIGDKIVSVIIE